MARALGDRSGLDYYRDISPDDAMRTGPVENYYGFGLAALECMELALRAAGARDPGAILDLPSGHGRVLRMLRARYPSARITACDLDRSAVDWCAEHLGAVPVYSEIDPSGLAFDDEFDLIWCGSLFTHLDRDRWDQLLGLFVRSLAPEGVLVFTTAGRLIADELRTGKRTYAVVSLGRLVDSFDRLGFGYEHYHDSSTYGAALASPTWVCKKLERYPDLRLLLYTERGWFGRQDAIACTYAAT